MTANETGLDARRCEVSAQYKEPQDYCYRKSMG